MESFIKNPAAWWIVQTLRCLTVWSAIPLAAYASVMLDPGDFSNSIWHVPGLVIVLIQAVTPFIFLTGNLPPKMQAYYSVHRAAEVFDLSVAVLTLFGTLYFVFVAPFAVFATGSTRRQRLVRRASATLLAVWLIPYTYSDHKVRLAPGWYVLCSAFTLPIIALFWTPGKRPTPVRHGFPLDPPTPPPI